ncbi:hypothetical protein H7F15_13050 [Pontibacter sp. Tf4]|uniref:hypothetical protein n=1 Tax=Pontibacter sp. Tf4 TaxID=2761620 RepID=UPI0016254DFD|nr:hypothetical protein [Pontibacter sp. Tf4]MBB6611971.1 hypothetical protein [Pontibacter sp. Tf4]
MEELTKLVELLENKGKSTTAAFLNYADSSSLETRLYQLIKDNAVESEPELIQNLYGDFTKANAFKMLKTRVKKKLYNQLLFLDLSGFEISFGSNSAELECRHYLQLANMFRVTGETALARIQLQKAMVLAEEVQLIDCQIEAYKALRAILTIHGFNRREYEECISKLAELYTLAEYEKRADELFHNIKFEYKLGANAGNSLINTLKDVTDELKASWHKTNLYTVFRRYHQLMNFYFELNGDFAAYIDYLNQTFDDYRAGKIHKAYFSESFTKYLLVYAYLKNGDYALGIQEAEQLKKKLPEGSKNWFAHLENYFLLAVHAQKFELAEKILLEAFNNKHFKENNQFAQERWTIFYQVYQSAYGFSIPVKLRKKLIVVQQDKKGFNLWCVILDFMTALDNRHTNLIASEAERMKKYIARYLTAKEDARSKYMLKLLVVAGREFPIDAASCRKKSEYLFSKLQEAPVPGYAYAETEIIPYEDLWEIILQKLDASK